MASKICFVFVVSTLAALAWLALEDLVKNGLDYLAAFLPRLLFPSSTVLRITVILYVLLHVAVAILFSVWFVVEFATAKRQGTDVPPCADFEFPLSSFCTGALIALVWLVFEGPIKHGLNSFTVAATSLLLMVFHAALWALTTLILTFSFLATDLILARLVRVINSIKAKDAWEKMEQERTSKFQDTLSDSIASKNAPPDVTLLPVAVLSLLVFQFRLLSKAAETSSTALAFILKTRDAGWAPEEDDVDIPGGYHLGFEFIAVHWLVLILVGRVGLIALEIGVDFINMALCLLNWGIQNRSLFDDNDCLCADDSTLTLVGEDELKSNDTKSDYPAPVTVPSQSLIPLFSQSAPAILSVLEDHSPFSHQMGSGTTAIIHSPILCPAAEAVKSISVPISTQDGAGNFAAVFDPESVLLALESSTSRLIETIPSKLVQNVILQTADSPKADLSSTSTIVDKDRPEIATSILLPSAATGKKNKNLRSRFASKIRATFRRRASVSSSPSSRTPPLILLPIIKSMNMFGC